MAAAKPQKVYLENTNIIHSLAFQNINTGNIRETFFANQLRTKHKVNTAKNGLTRKTLCLDMRLYLCRKNDGKGIISIRIFALRASNGDS